MNTAIGLLTIFFMGLAEISKYDVNVPRGQARGPGMSEKALAAPSAPVLATLYTILPFNI